MAVVFEAKEGALTAKMDIQGQTGVPLQNASYEASRVYFELPAPQGKATFDGEHSGEEITGTFSQAGVEGTFTLARGEAVIEEEEPAEPLPYDEEEVTFTNEDLKFAGTLTLPDASGPHPAVVMITGSGPQNRDEEVFGFKIFRVIADHFTRNGIAVLRYDDRGVGGSTGKNSDGTSEAFATDALAAIRFLKTRPDINSGQIGLVGHSEGGIVAPIAASRSDDVTFAVLIAGTSVTGAEILYEQGALIAKANGATEEDLVEMRDGQTRTFKAIRTGQGWEELEAQAREQVAKSLEEMPEEDRAKISDPEEHINNVVNTQLAGVKTPWFKYFLDHDPKVALRKTKVPVLAIFGELDLQVPPSQNLAPMEQALKESGNEDYTIHVFPKANHLFQEATTGSPTEYGGLPKEFVPGFLELMTEWIQARTSVHP
jgi:pimeloyl-ACP methyl ester carboxylesterase